MENVLHDDPPASSGSLVHSLNEFVEPAFAMFDCVQSEVLLASNSVEPERPSRATSYVPVCGATTVIANEPTDLKKTSSVGSTPKDESSWMSAKGARATTSHGGGGWLGGSGDGDGGGGLGSDGDMHVPHSLQRPAEQSFGTSQRPAGQKHTPQVNLQSGPLVRQPRG